MPRPADLTTLIIRHLPSTDPPQFQVQRLSDGKTTSPVAVPSPAHFHVKGRPDNCHLTPELRWYLETFLDYPFPPETDHAEQVQTALQDWGKQAFQTLFSNLDAAPEFFKATHKGYDRLLLQISSDDPTVLAWPWEALHHPKGDRLAVTCQIERRPNQADDPPPLSKKLPKDRVNILLVIARPYERDVRFRSIARPLVEVAVKPDMPAEVHVLRPPTFDQLREYLKQRPNFYHILHFDGHGAYSVAPAGRNTGHTLLGKQGRLIFETADGKDDPIEAERLSELLREHAVPAVVLNACQSAMLDETADDPFASVAAALLNAGMRSVVAMAYSLYVSGAQQFLPAFYRGLFETGNVARAVRAGRQEMRAHPERVCARGTFPLEDWLVPVLYQQDPLDFSFAKKDQATERPESRLPEEARDTHNPYGFVGRDRPLLELERALHRAPAGILITGLGGVGKTTLARGFLRWLEETGGLGDGVFWFSFVTIRSVEYVLNTLGDALLSDPSFRTWDTARKVEELAKECRKQRLLIVWDNFESVKGVAGTTLEANLSETDCRLLHGFLGLLRGGQTKVLITSRSPEDWLGGPDTRYLLKLPGLDGEERWEFVNTILRDQGKHADRSDPAFKYLVELLNGHPLTMRVILPRLERQTIAELIDALRRRFVAPDQIDANDPERHDPEKQLFAALQIVQDSLPDRWKALLTPLALHEGFVNAHFLTMMAEKIDATWTREIIDEFLNTLTRAGLLRDHVPQNYELHPALTGFLRPHEAQRNEPTRENWRRAFVSVWAISVPEIGWWVSSVAKCQIPWAFVQVAPQNPRENRGWQRC
jgi:hypothetical protein